MHQPQPTQQAGSTDRPEASALRRRGGRPRDASRDTSILEETLAVLAESGYDGLTIDKVAARVGAARATIYRRWPTKADLVLQAVQHLSRDDAGVDRLPDTGTLRGDLVAMVLPQNEQEQEYRLRVLAGVASLALTEDPRLGQAAATAGVGVWAEAVELLLSRAVKREEYSPTDVHALAQVMPMMCLARAVTRQPITHEFSLALIDGVVLPAMRGSR